MWQLHHVGFCPQFDIQHLYPGLKTFLPSVMNSGSWQWPDRTGRSRSLWSTHGWEAQNPERKPGRPWRLQLDSPEHPGFYYKKKQHMQKAETGHSRASNTLLGRKSAKKRSDSKRDLMLNNVLHHTVKDTGDINTNVTYKNLSLKFCM